MGASMTSLYRNVSIRRPVGFKNGGMGRRHEELGGVADWLAG
jgi:hypothetical protein